MIENPEFLNPSLRPNNLDRYIIRSSILNALKEILPQLHGTLLDVGCGQMPYKPLFLAAESKVEHYIGLDLDGSIHTQIQKPDLVWDGQLIPLKNETVDCAIATEVFEHCPEPEKVMKEIWRVLKPGGVLFFTVPFLWNLHEVPHDEYRYTPFALTRHLQQAGFTTINIQATGGWNASFGQILGLWVRRYLYRGRKPQKLLAIILSYLMLPLIGFLYQHDHPPQIFSEGTMITGLKGIAQKSA